MYGIVRQSGGSGRGSNPGEGTTFNVVFPGLSRRNDRAPGGQAPDGSAAPPKPSLLVEDEDGAGLARQVLGVYGYTVLEARHGGEALLTWNGTRDRST